MLDGSEYFECACHSFDHTLRFVLDLDENVAEDDWSFPTIYAEVMLGHYLPWYKRVWLGIKYIFGYDVQFAYSCWEINHESDTPDKMIDMLEKLKVSLKKAEERRQKIIKNRQIKDSEEIVDQPEKVNQNKIELELV